MNPRFLKTFLRVAHHGSVTRAARELHLAQSSVSDQIQVLEEELGSVLFLRSKQGLRPTPAGEALVAHAREILDALESAREAVAAADGSAERSIVIGALETIAVERLPPSLARLREAHPELRIRVEVAGSAELLERLHDARIDVAFCFRRGELDRKLVRRTIASEPLVLIGPPTTEPAALGSVQRAPGDIRFIATQPGCVYRHLFDEAWRQAGKTLPKPSIEADSIGAIVRLVAAGSGFALVPQLAAQRELHRGSVASYPWFGGDAAATLDMVWRRRRRQMPGLMQLLASMEGMQSVRRGDGRRPHEAPCRS